MKHLTLYSNEAPFLIVALYKKIYKELMVNQKVDNIQNQAKITVPKFTMKKLKLLQSLNHIFTNSPDCIVKQLSTNSNIFTILLDFPIKYEWNSIVLVEV